MEQRYKSIYKNRIQKCLSNGQFYTAENLASWAGLRHSEKSDTYPVTRGLVREMIDEGLLIGSTAKGYKLMDTAKEVQQCLNSLLKRQMGISRRIQSIYDAAQDKGIL